MLPRNLKPSPRKLWGDVKAARRFKAMGDPSNEANLALDIGAGYRVFWQLRKIDPPQVASNGIEDETAFVEWYLKSFQVQSVEDGNMRVKEEPYIEDKTNNEDD